MLKSIRGAITVGENTKEAIWAASREMLEAVMARNFLRVHEVSSVFFTATRDLTAAYPAVAARELGFTEAALMCAQEMYVEGSLPMCLRVCVLADLGYMEPTHVYLKGAAALRPDLAGEKP